MDQTDSTTDTPDPPLFRSRWVFPCGLFMALAILAFQWPQFSWNVEHGLRFDSGKARIQTIWNLLVLLSSGTAIGVWCVKRPDLPHAAVVLVGCMLGLWALTLPVAMVVSGIVASVFY